MSGGVERRMFLPSRRLSPLRVLLVQNFHFFELLLFG